MAGPFGGLNVASQALRSFQRALATSGHNLANVNTPGYSRQRVTFAMNEPIKFFEKGWRAVGQGVSVVGIQRIRDNYLEVSANKSTAELARLETTSGGLGRIEEIYSELGAGSISGALDKFFDSWSGLAANPSDTAARVDVRGAGQVLADRIRNSYGDLQSQQIDTHQQIKTAIQQVDLLAKKIDTLNKAVRASLGQDGENGDLLDQRDQAIRDLAGLVNVSTSTFPDGSIAVYAAGYTLVDSAGSRPFPQTYNSATGTVNDGSADYVVRGGTLAGLLSTHAAYENQKATLDGLANSLKSQINGIHSTGYNSYGATGVNFFNDGVPQTGAADFDLTTEIKSDVKNIAAGMTANPGDGAMAQALAGLRDTAITGLGNVTFHDYWRDNVSKLSGEVNYYSSLADTERSVNEQIQNRIQAVSGVSIDDEMADMVKFQRSYQAAARALTIFDQVAEDLISMVRR
ncbi:MAG: flagellar hook-associated protein FlgK [Fimbriimonadaceae bacterium]|nr:flagellar hook-associated protein FlgK [Fimbriimonadaceae bacterium]QYK55892.1 MAG: flagellar hook-associated protein FlgK [Fimbriimonadaceae bacterium]